MKVAVVSIGSFDTQYSDYHIMRDIIVGLLERGHVVDLFQKQYLREPYYPEQFNKFLGKQLLVHNVRFEKKAKAKLKARYVADLTYYWKVCHLLKQSNPDKIFLQSNNTAFITVFYAKHILKCPLVYNEQDIFPENAFYAGILSKNSLVYHMAHILQKYAYKNVSGLTTISDDMKNTIVRRYGIAREKIEVIYNWGHEELSVPHSDAENSFLLEYPKKSGEFRVLYAGNLGKMQNVELVLKAADLMKHESNVRFYIVGNGSIEQQLKVYVQEKEMHNVTFANMQAPEKVGDLYSSADVNIIPLQKNLIYAALPSKTADCLISEKPIITCVDNESEFAKMMQSYGFANVDPASPELLCNCIREVEKVPKEPTANVIVLKKFFSQRSNVARHCEAIINARYS